MNTIENIQEGFKKEAEKVAAAASSDKAAAETKPAPEKAPPVDKTKEQEGQNGGEKGKVDPPPASGEVSLSRFLKEKHGIDISDEEILKRIKDNGDSKQPAKPDSVTAPPAPRIEDITDDVVGEILEKSGRPRDLVARAKELKDKSDIDIVRQHYVDLLKKEHNISESEASDLFNERFFIPPAGQEDPYTAEEKKIGQALLKQEADVLRGKVDYIIDGIRNTALSERQAAYQKNVFTSTVDSFLSKASRKFTIPIGKSGAKDFGEFPFEVLDDAAFQRVADTMRDPGSFANRFKNEDGVFDLQRFYDFLLRTESLDNIHKSMANYYHSKGVDEIEAKLNNDPDLTNVGKESPDKKNKTPQEQKKEAEEYNKAQIDRYMGREARSRN